MNKKKKTRKNKILAILAIAVMVIGCTYFALRISDLQKINSALETRKARLLELLNEETVRQQELENEEVYVQTQKYIEERAKAIGYVYPDEIIFRKGK